MIVHIAGVDVQIGSQKRQRCSWCGAVLIDMDLAAINVPVGQGPPPCWEVGALVARDDGASYVMEHIDGDQLPPEACARLDHSITGAGR